MLASITEKPLDDGTEHFPPSGIEITSIDVANEATNVTPASGRARLNIRYNDRHDGAGLEQWLRACCDAVGGNYQLDINVSGESFLTPPGPLSDIVAAAVEATTGRVPELGTTGGTSDARFIRDHCPVVEFGLINQTAHKVDEFAALSDIVLLTGVYQAVLERFFEQPS